jgi:hypothetical protein
MPVTDLPETQERRCPACQSYRIMSIGRVLATEAGAKQKRWCEACGVVFVLVRKLT